MQDQKYPICVLLSPLSPKCRSNLLYGQPFPSYGPKCRDQVRHIIYDTPKGTPITTKTTLNTICTHVCSISLPESQISLNFASTASRFWATGHFEKRPQNDSKMILNTASLKVPYICLIRTLVPKFQSVLLYGLPFSTFRFLETSAPNDHKRIFNTTRLKEPHTCSTSTPESQISPRFNIHSAVFEL